MKRVPTRARGQAPDAALRRSYDNLLDRTRALLGRIKDETSAQTEFQRLSWFALQRSSSALALFREGHVVLANSRWHAWASARGGAVGWIVAEGGRRHTYEDLGTLAATELERAGRGEAAHLRVERRDGKRVLRLRLERVLPRGQEPIGLVLGDDITGDTERDAEMVSLRDEVRKREQMGALGRMAAGVAHDLGNTLNALSLRVQRLGRSAGQSEVSEHLPSIDEAIEMMRSTLERLDRFSGRRTRPLQPVELRRVIRAAVGMAGLGTGRKAGEGAAKVRATLALPQKLPRVLADANELCNVFVNLLINARDAMPEGGTVLVDATVGARHVTVRVCDQGPGFAPDELPRVFEPFFTTKGARGSGLGLSLAYGFMESIGGAIRAANRPDGGAELTLELPIPHRRRRGVSA